MWSYGMILYTLFTVIIPYQHLTNYDAVKKAILSGKELPILPSNMPNTLKQIITTCWNIESAERRTFKLLAEEDKWDDIIKEALLHGETKYAADLWNQSVDENFAQSGVRGGLSVPWPLFLNKFYSFMGIERIDQTEVVSRCLKEVMTVKEQSPTPILERQAFSEFLKVFTPFPTSKEEGSAYVDQIIQLIKEPWFYGASHNRLTAEAVINIARDKGRKSPCMVRISTNAGGKFCLTYLDEKDRRLGGKPLEIEHLAINPSSYQTIGYYKYLKDEIKKKKLSWYNYARPFDHILRDTETKPSRLVSHIKDNPSGSSAFQVVEGFTSGSVVII